ncbi:hypothetical protein HPB50_012964 [Hyalomma asiaticum]|uniref:Uncharacterized protein n=1 Tax=Hyalomma asiaticum TaxID=266040 RepID=A0ACB7RUE6_HYAAI|nr:hypothetical protein HPB50_012964 [Hyalomma asiaticum]
MVFERDGAMYELYRHQFHVRVQRSDVVARSADGIRHRYNNEGGSSSEDSLAPVKQKWPSRKVKRKIRLPAIYRRRNTPPSRAVVHRQTKSDLELAPPFLVQDCLRYVRAKDAGQRLVVKQYCIPDIIYRALQQYANISEDQNDNSAIVFLHDSVSLVGGGPQAIQFAQSSDATTNTGLFQSIKR